MFPAPLSGGLAEVVSGHQDIGFNPMEMGEIAGPFKAKVVEFSGQQQDHHDKEMVSKPP